MARSFSGWAGNTLLIRFLPLWLHGFLIGCWVGGRQLGKVLQNLARGIRSAGSVQRPSWMRTRPAQVESGYRCTIASPAQKWTHGEELVQRQFALAHVSSSESILALDVGRREYLLSKNARRKIGSVSRKHLDHRVRQSLIPRWRPIPFPQTVRRILHMNGHDMLARGSKRSIEQTGNTELQKRLARKFAVLRIVKCALQGVDGTSDLNPPRQCLR